MLVKLKPCLLNTHAWSLTERPSENQTCQSLQQKRQLLQKNKKTTTTERQLWPEISLVGVSGLFFCYLRIPPATVQLCWAVQGTTICVWRRRRRRVFFFFPPLQVASVSWIPDWSQENSGKHVNWPVTTATRSPSAAAKQCTTAANTWFTPSCWLNPESNTAATQDVLKRAISGTGSHIFAKVGINTICTP